MSAPINRRLIRAALAQTASAFPMPARRTELSSLAGRLLELRQKSLERHVALLETAARLGARLVALSELFATPYFAVDADPLWRALAEDAREGPTASAMRRAAQRLGMVVIAPLYETDKSSGKRFNTAIVIDLGGEIVGSYRKLHLASGEGPAAPGRPATGLAEAFHYDAGDGRQGPRTRADVSGNPFFPVFETMVGRVGVALGADRRFPGTVESLGAEGAEIVLCLQAACDPESLRLWDAESLVDCARHRVFIGAGNRIGREAPWGREYFGQSAWYGPEGKLDNESPVPELVVSDLDLAMLADLPQSPLRLERDGRPETYSSRKRPKSRK